MISLTDGAQYKITIKKWLTPKGNWINETEGIEPDEVVELDDKYFNIAQKRIEEELNKQKEKLF